MSDLQADPSPGRRDKATKRTGALDPLRYPAFRYLVAGRTVTMAGNAVAPIALAFAVLDLTGSVRDLGLVVGVRSFANVVFVLFGGVIADRLPRHLVMVGASALACTIQAAVAGVVLTGSATIPLLLALSAVNGLAAALALPASSALVPQTVPAEVRQQANAINRLAFNTAMIGGASLGGLLVATAGPGWGLAVDAATFGVAALLFLLVRVSPLERAATARAGIFADLRLGWTAFASRTWLWVVVAGFCVINAAMTGGMNVLGPVVADETFGRKAWGLVLAVQTAGMIVGALAALRVRVSRLLLYGVVWCLGNVLLLAALGLTPHVVPLMLAGFAVGFAVEQFGMAWETTMQEHVPGEMLARVYSYDILGSILAVPVGQIAAGPLAEHFGTRTTLLGAAVLCGFAVAGMLLNRDVRRLPHAL
ncbi:MFS transporter [Dactylosporangium fulvum]|uniref:MFS transporter n=1 Tax=Dactylosporangium fulvum TaxID=53359 RepID=A0ABY5VTK5_9ACTN|nr:MFS transporter [Dactylosporangium fulvum]UWP80484.1 MFS transporter [Dactylosporangium fulvum]